MTNVQKSGTFTLGDRAVYRLGYGAMQLAGRGVFGPPKDHHSAVAVLREAVASGVDHIDTSDFYGPHVVNRLIREALHHYPKDLFIVSKLGARRGADASWNPAFSAEELTSAVHDNLRHLGVDALDAVNLRLMFGVHGPAEGSLEAPLISFPEASTTTARPVATCTSRSSSASRTSRRRSRNGSAPRSGSRPPSGPTASTLRS